MATLLDIDQLRTFVAIADTGSFTRAAEIVHKTQSAVSMQMKRLEERLGKPVFEREGRASKLTEDGERLLDYARRMLRLNSECVASFADAELAGRGVYAGTLTIGGLIERGDIHRMFLAEADRLGGLTVGTLDPDVLADAAWDLYKNRDSAETTFNVLT